MIYVGMTNDIPTRFGDHFRLKPWRREVARYSITWYDTRAEAEQVETAEIERLQPRYNIAGNAARPRKAGGNTMRDIVAVLGGQIQSGALAPGDRIPSMAALCRTYGCSSTPVRQALLTLKAQGLIEGRQGDGIFVRKTSATLAA